MQSLPAAVVVVQVVDQLKVGVTGILKDAGPEAEAEGLRGLAIGRLAGASAGLEVGRLPKVKEGLAVGTAGSEVAAGGLFGLAESQEKGAGAVVGS